MQMNNFKCYSLRNNLGNFHYLYVVVVLPRNMLEKDKGDNLKFGTNLRNSVKNSQLGFLGLITLLEFLL